MRRLLSWIVVAVSFVIFFGLITIIAPKCIRDFFDASVTPVAKVGLATALLFGIIFSVYYYVVLLFRERVRNDERPIAVELSKGVVTLLLQVIAIILFLDVALKITQLVVEERMKVEYVLDGLIMALGGVTFIGLQKGLDPLLRNAAVTRKAKPDAEKIDFETFARELRSYLILYIFLAVNVILLAGVIVLRSFIVH